MFFFFLFVLINGQNASLLGQFQASLRPICATMTRQDCSSFTLSQLLTSVGSSSIELAKISLKFTKNAGFLKSVPVESINVNDDNLQIFYQVFNKKSRRPPIVIQPGYTRVKEDFGFLTQLLSKLYPVLIFDPRGVGETGPGTNILQPYTAKQMSRDTNDLVKHVFGEDKRIYLMGFSMGAKIAIQYNDDFSDNVKGLVFGAAGGSRNTAVRGDCYQDLFRLLSKPSNQLTGADTLRLSECLYGKSFASQNIVETLFLIFQSRQFPKSRQGVLLQTPLATSQNFDGSNLLSEISVPTLVLQGTEDLITNPQSGQNIVNEINKSSDDDKIAKFENIQDDGHLFESTDPVEVFNDFRKWVNFRKFMRKFRKRKRYAKPQPFQQK